MERMKIFLRKDTITSENKTEFLENSFNHTKQQKLSFNSSVEKTKLVVDTMVSERSQRTSSSSDINMTGTFQQNMENNFVLDKTYHVIENCELINTNEVIDQKDTYNSRNLNAADAACIQSNINLNISANNYDNSHYSTQDNEKACLGERNIASPVVYGNPIVSLDDCEKDETLVKVYNLNEVRTKFTAKNNISENENIKKMSTKVKNESRNKKEIKNMNLKCKLGKQESEPKGKFIKNNVKVNYQCFASPVNNIKINKFKKATANKSVTDLINYFENLNNIKGSNVKHVKSEENLLKCNEIMELGIAENSNRSVKSNALSNISGAKIKQTDCSKSYKRNFITRPEAIVAGGDANKYQTTLSSTTEVGLCKGNCDPFENIKHLPENKIIQEHIFIFSDDSGKKEFPATQTLKSIRTRFTRKMNRPNNEILFSECYPNDDENVHSSLTSNEAKEKKIFFKNNLNQTAVKNCLNDSGSALSLNQDLEKRRKHQEHFLPKIKCTNSTKRVSSRKLFIGIFLSATIFVAFWKVLAQYSTYF